MVIPQFFVSTITRPKLLIQLCVKTGVIAAAILVLSGITTRRPTNLKTQAFTTAKTEQSKRGIHGNTSSGKQGMRFLRMEYEKGKLMDAVMQAIEELRGEKLLDICSEACLLIGVVNVGGHDLNACSGAVDRLYLGKSLACTDCNAFSWNVLTKAGDEGKPRIHPPRLYSASQVANDIEKGNIDV